MSISSQIKHDIPAQIRRFKKLTSGRPYFYHCWKSDRAGKECLNYRFLGRNGKTEHVKKIPLSELEAAVRRFQYKRSFDRSDFKKVCPSALSSGPCGFAVIGRYLEFRFNARYQGRGNGFVL